MLPLCIKKCNKGPNTLKVEICPEVSLISRQIESLEAYENSFKHLVQLKSWSTSFRLVIQLYIELMRILWIWTSGQFHIYNINFWSMLNVVYFEMTQILALLGLFFP